MLSSLIWVHIVCNTGHQSTVKPVLRGHSKRRPIFFQDQLSYNAGQKYCRMLQESILQYLQPSLSYHLNIVLSILSGRLRQVLLYIYRKESRWQFTFLKTLPFYRLTTFWRRSVENKLNNVLICTKIHIYTGPYVREFKILFNDFINLAQVHNFTVSAQDIFTFRWLSVFTISFTGI